MGPLPSLAKKNGIGPFFIYWRINSIATVTLIISALTFLREIAF